MSDLKELRDQINEITQEMIMQFEKRLDVSKEIALYKKAHDMPIFQPEREKELIEKYTSNVKYDALTEQFLIHLMSLSKELQKEEINK